MVEVNPLPSNQSKIGRRRPIASLTIFDIKIDFDHIKFDVTGRARVRGSKKQQKSLSLRFDFFEKETFEVFLVWNRFAGNQNCFPRFSFAVSDKEAAVLLAFDEAARIHDVDYSSLSPLPS